MLFPKHSFENSHVAGCLNVEADELSRGLNLNEELKWALDMDIFQGIVCRFGKLDIDLFASKLNYKLEKYISFRPDPNAMVVDAFSISWTKQYVFIFAFFSTLSMVLRKIVEDEAEALVIAPLWTTQNWWTQLAHLFVDFPIKLPPSHKILYQPNDPERTHPIQKLNLGHFPYQGSFARQRNSGRVCQTHHSSVRQSSKKQYECDFLLSVVRQWYCCC